MPRVEISLSRLMMMMETVIKTKIWETEAKTIKQEMVLEIKMITPTENLQQIKIMV